MRASRTPGAADHFDLWNVPGRKRLTLGDAGLLLTVELSAQRLRVSLAGDLAHGAAYACAVPLVSGLRGQLDAFNAQAQALGGQAPSMPPARSVTRAGLLHLRALQALDATQGGASHRDIAQALFGLNATVQRWHEDSELRAQVRHLLRRALTYMDGGYLSLVAPRSAALNPPGDEPLR